MPARMPKRKTRRTNTANVGRGQKDQDDINHGEATKGDDASPQHVEPTGEVKEAKETKGCKKEKYVRPTLRDGRPMVDQDRYRSRIDRQVQAEGIKMYGLNDDWYWMDNCHVRRRTATLGEIEPREPTQDDAYDDGAIFSMDL